MGLVGAEKTPLSGWAMRPLGETLNAMNNFSEALVDTDVADLQREARKPRDRAAAHEEYSAPRRFKPCAVTLRLGTPADLPALTRLAALDSSDVPSAPVMLAEVGGELRAAESLGERTVIADPFHPTASLVELLLRWAEQALADRSPRLRRLREVVRTRHPRHRRLLVQGR